MYVEATDCKMLLDVGLKYNETKKLLREIGVKLSDIDYILVTHAHKDHIESLEKILEVYDIPVVASFGCLMGVDVPEGNIVYAEHDEWLELENIRVLPLEVAHDASETMCFTIVNSFGEKLLYLTDCGTIPLYDFENYDVYIVEANYSLELMDANYEGGKVPMIRYTRTTGADGHLSLEDCIELLVGNVGADTTQIILSHLSGDNANAESFKEQVCDVLPLFDVEVAHRGLNIKVGDNEPF